MAKTSDVCGDCRRTGGIEFDPAGQAAMVWCNSKSALRRADAGVCVKFKARGKRVMAGAPAGHWGPVPVVGGGREGREPCAS